MDLPKKPRPSGPNLNPYIFGSGPEAYEAISAFGLRYNQMPWGHELSQIPSQSRILIICGPVVGSDVEKLKNVWEQMPSPKWAVAYGACSYSGGPFSDLVSYKNLGEILPLTHYLPGPASGQEGLIEVLNSISSEGKGGERYG